MKEARWCGGHVYWTSQPTPLAPLTTALTNAGLAKYIPSPYSIGESLAHAVEECKGRDCIVQRRKSAEECGYEMVKVKRGDEKTRNDYSEMRLAARVVHAFDCGLPVERVEITDGNASLDDLQKAYDWARAHVSATGMSKMILAIITDLCGTCLKEHGGLYYVPPTAAVADGNGGTVEVDCVRVVQNFAKTLASISKTELVVDEIRMGSSGIGALLAALNREMAAEVDRIMREVQSPDLQRRACENREREAMGLLDKVAKYRKTLVEALEGVDDAQIVRVNENLDDLNKGIFKAAEMAAAMAQIKASASIMAECAAA